MNTLVFDLESNGLLEVADVVHVACCKDKEGDEFYTNDAMPMFLDMLSQFNGILVCHNLIGYDLPLLEKLYGYKHKGVVLDTLVLSKLLNPERRGRHSLGAWGERLGIAKPEHEDWSKYSPEMLHRCRQDVEINWLVLEALMKESGLTLEDLCQIPKY